MPFNQRLLRPVSASRYAALRAGLVAYWPMNETASSGDVTAEDWTKRGNNLSSNNSVLSTTGRINNGRLFVRNNSEWLSVTSSDLALGEPAWTMTFWFFVASGASNSFFILAAKDESGARQFAINYNLSTAGATSTDALTWTYYATSAGGLNAGVTGVARNQWNFLTWSHEANASVINCSLNRSSTATLSRTGGDTFTTFSSGFSVGRRNFSGFHEYADATIDELAVWNRALSDAQLDALYNSGVGIDLRS